MNTIKIALQNVINSKNYKLLDVQRKIKELWASRDLVDEEKNELLSQAEANLNPETERPEIMEMLAKLSARIEVLEAKHAAGDEGTEGGESAENIPAWKPWDGISKDYAYGAKVAHKGKIWVSKYQGQNTWEPGVVGTENLWEEWVEEAE